MAEPDPLIRLNAVLDRRYHVERKLGAGGMAAVYLATDLRHQRKVALKVLKPELAAVVGAARFLAEIRTTAGLQHPHILPLFDSGEADGLLFYVMPYVEGESLRERLERERQLPVDEAVRIASDVAEALDHAHRQGVVHRDIKPANILLRDGQPLVADFGIALALGAAGDSRLTETGLSLGTPHYMSPEQATGDRRVGPGSDIWALACVLYEMLAGEPPFTGGTPHAVLGKIMTADRPSVRVDRPAVPDHVDAVIRHGLERVPADRFATVGDLGAALHDPGFRNARDPVPGPRSGWPTWVVAGAFLLGAATWAFASGVLGPAADSRGGPARQLEFEVPGTFSNTLDRVVAISDDGSRVALEADGRVSVRSVARSADPLLPLVDGRHPFFSPDGSWVGFFEGVSANLVKMRVTGGVPLPVTEGGERSLGATWGEDGFIVFATVSGLYRVSEDGGEVEMLARPDTARGELYLAWPEALPRGRGVVYTVVYTDATSDSESVIEGLDFESRERTPVLSGGSAPRYAPHGQLVYSGGGELRAVAFDPDGLSIEGQPYSLGFDGIALPRGTGADFDIASDGTLIRRMAGAETEAPRVLAWVDRDGNQEVIPAPPRRYTYPRVSPDGQHILVDIGGANRDLYVWDLVRGTLDRLTQDPFEDLFGHWGSGGSTVYFSSDRLGTLRTFVQSIEGMAPASPLPSGDGVDMVGDVSRDGDFVVVMRQEPGRTDFDLIAVPTWAGGEESTLLASEFNEVQPSVSPDGAWIGYQSDDSGQAEVYIGPVDGLDRWRVRVSVDGGANPAWHPSGRELYFRGLDGSVHVAEVGFQGGGAPIVGAVTELFPNPGDRFRVGTGRRYDPSPIDDRLLFVLTVEGEAPGRVVLSLDAVTDLGR